MTDPHLQVIECPACHGDGGFEHLYSYDPRNGEPCGYWQKCEACEGLGEIEEEIEELGLDDLLERCGDD